MCSHDLSAASKGLYGEKLDLEKLQDTKGQDVVYFDDDGYLSLIIRAGMKHAVAKDYGTMVPASQALAAPQLLAMVLEQQKQLTEIRELADRQHSCAAQTDHQISGEYVVKRILEIINDSKS